MEQPVSDTLTVTQIAAKLGLSAGTVYGMIRDNRFPIRPLPIPGKKLLFSKAAVERLVENQR